MGLSEWFGGDIVVAVVVVVGGGDGGRQLGRAREVSGDGGAGRRCIGAVSVLFLLQLLCSFDGACLTSASYPARLLVVRGWGWWWQLVVMVKGSWYGERESADYAPVMSRQLLA